MGMLSYLYADLKSADQKMIAKKSYHNIKRVFKKLASLFDRFTKSLCTV